MSIDHKKNLLFLEQEKYLEEYYDIDENKSSYGITESGIKALIVWNKIHGLEDPVGITMSYPNPISEEETQIIFSQFVKKLNYVILCFTLPTLLSFLMIYSLSFLTPSFSDHYMEFNSLFWVIAITLGMSIIPTFINLFVILYIIEKRVDRIVALNPLYVKLREESPSTAG